MTTVYCVQQLDGHWYYATKAEAVAAAREEKKAGDPYVAVMQHTLATPAQCGGLRQLYCALLNSESFAVSSREVDV